jgi:hypothetical protein
MEIHGDGTTGILQIPGIALVTTLVIIMVGEALATMDLTMGT